MAQGSIFGGFEIWIFQVLVHGTKLLQPKMDKNCGSHLGMPSKNKCLIYIYIAVSLFISSFGSCSKNNFSEIARILTYLLNLVRIRSDFTFLSKKNAKIYFPFAGLFKKCSQLIWVFPLNLYLF